MTVSVNGRALSIDGYPAHTTLLDFLRSHGLTGAKEGCAEGECGACTVAMVRPAPQGSVYVPVNSCLLFLTMCAGQEIVTVEALTNAPAQQAMAAGGGSQCGYCTPGFVMSMFCAQYSKGSCDPHDLGGNLCRCTGYRPIADAARSLGPPPAGPLLDRLSRPAPPLNGPTTLHDCFALMDRHPGARLVAGATDLAVESNLKLRRYPFLISLEAIPELRDFTETADAIEIGAARPLSEIDVPHPVWREWTELFASPLIRNRATLGGNLATASPIGDGAPLLLALDARLRLASAAGERTVPLDEFFLAYRMTALAPGELIRSILIPKPLPPVAHFHKAAKRRLDDISTVAAAVAFHADGSARLAYGGVAPTPIRIREAEPFLAKGALDEVDRILTTTLNPISDHRGTAPYRLALAKSFVRRVANPPRRLPTAGSERSSQIAQRAHESAQSHVTGEALYSDDLLPRFPALLHAWPVLAPHAHARVTALDVTPALEEPGVVTTLTAADVPGEGDTGASRRDEPLFPTEVMFHSQPVAWVLAETLDAAQRGAARVRVEYQPLPAILTIDQAIVQQSFLAGPHRIANGTPPDGPHVLEAELRIGGQEHFYLETQSAIAWLDETGGVALHSSTQHPTEGQEIVARVLGVPKNRVTVECLRMGGAFGGKEVQANAWCVVAALGAWKTRRPVRVRLTRALDIALTGKRHPYLAKYRVAFDSDGRLGGLTATLYSDGGWSVDLSEPVLWRSLFHIDNAYYLPAVEVTGYVCRTHKTSQTAFRGFGGPQGMLVIEDALGRIAGALGISPEVVRERNLYREGDATHYGQPVKDAARIGRIWKELLQSSDFEVRKGQIREFNARNRGNKRGIALTPVKFGISFTAIFFNQAGALVLIYRDGSVQVNHGGTEMGQGLHTKIREVAARTLGVPIESVRVMPTRTDKVPNTSPTAASSGSDLNGAAVADACRCLNTRLAPIAATLPAGATFAQVVEKAYRERIPLFAQGYYRTPGIHFDPVAGRGNPFHYFAYGAAVTEVEIDSSTGEHRILRVDILQDVGESLAPVIDLGQVEGGYIQGLGWLTLEELLWDDQGRVSTSGASTYKLPSWSEVPEEFHVAFLERAAEEGVIFGSKAVGEPPLMLAISAREAIRDAIAAFGDGGIVEIDSPCTPERIFWAVQAYSKRAAGLAK